MKRTPGNICDQAGRESRGTVSPFSPASVYNLFVRPDMLHVRNIYTHRGSRSKRLTEYSRLILYRDIHSSVYLY